jgi:hypothetical protein
VIAFALCVGSQEKLARCALPGLRRVAEPDSPVVEVTTDHSIFHAYNEVLDALAPREDLEALVLMHEDVELLAPDFCDRIRRRLAEPDVAVVGAIGARGVRSLAWWEYETAGRVSESRGEIDFGGGVHDVDVVDGLLLVLSPWAARTLRFDEERFSGFHGYDADICLQARAAGRRVVVDELPLHHHTKGGYGDEAAFLAADAAFRAKWLGGRAGAAAAA